MSEQITSDLLICLLRSPHPYTEAVNVTLRLALVQRATTAAHPEQSESPMGCERAELGQLAEMYNAYY